MKTWIMALTALFAFATASPVLAQPEAAPAQPAQPAQGDPVVEVPSDDAEMNAAMETARRTYSRFMDDYRAAPASSQRNFLVKVGLEKEGGGLEHIWVGDLRLDGERLMGRLANAPDFLPGLQRGSEVEVRTDQVSDWAILSNAGGMFGNFTDRVIADHAPAGEAERIRASLSPSPLPPSWTQ